MSSKPKKSQWTSKEFGLIPVGTRFEFDGKEYVKTVHDKSLGHGEDEDGKKVYIGSTFYVVALL